jgi:hypothetical protein
LYIYLSDMKSSSLINLLETLTLDIISDIVIVCVELLLYKYNLNYY